MRHELEPEDPDALTVTLDIVVAVPAVEIFVVTPLVFGVAGVVEPWFTPIPVAARGTWIVAAGRIAAGQVAAVPVADEVPAVSGTAPANAKTTIILLNARAFILTKIFKIETAIELPCQCSDAGPVLLNPC